MNTTTDSKSEKKELKKQEKRQQRKQKKNALVMTHDQSQFWITQKQFWQWVREGVIVKLSDGPLTGHFVRENEEKMVVLANTVLNLSCPNHLNEALTQRRMVGRR